MGPKGINDPHCVVTARSDGARVIFQHTPMSKLRHILESEYAVRLVGKGTPALPSLALSLWASDSTFRAQFPHRKIKLQQYLLHQAVTRISVLQ